MLISKRVTIGIIITMIALSIVWTGLRYYGGEKYSVGGYEFLFISSDFEKNENVKFIFINDETPVIVYVTNKVNAEKARESKPFHHLIGHEHNIGSFDRLSIEFNTPDKGEYGLLIRTQSDLDRATFRIQLRMPLTMGHVRYSIYLPISFSVVSLSSILTYSIKKDKNL